MEAEKKIFKKKICAASDDDKQSVDDLVCCWCFRWNKRATERELNSKGMKKIGGKLSTPFSFRWLLLTLFRAFALFVSVAFRSNTGITIVFVSIAYKVLASGEINTAKKYPMWLTDWLAACCFYQWFILWKHRLMLAHTYGKNNKQFSVVLPLEYLSRRCCKRALRFSVFFSWLYLFKLH